MKDGIPTPCGSSRRGTKEDLVRVQNGQVAGPGAYGRSEESWSAGALTLAGAVERMPASSVTGWVSVTWTVSPPSGAWVTARSTTGSEGPEQVATDREAGAPLTVTAKSPMSTLWQERGLVKMTETTLDPGAAITAFIDVEQDASICPSCGGMLRWLDILADYANRSPGGSEN